MPEASLNVVLLRHTPEPEEVVAMAAKLCYSPSGVEELKEKIEARDQADEERVLREIAGRLGEVRFEF